MSLERFKLGSLKDKLAAQADTSEEEVEKKEKKGRKLSARKKKTK